MKKTLCTLVLFLSGCGTISVPSEDYERYDTNKPLKEPEKLTFNRIEEDGGISFKDEK